MTTLDDVARWMQEGKEKGATHVIVVCDTFDWEDYPVYVMPGEDLQKKTAEYSGPNMQKVMEVIDLSKPRGYGG